MLRWQLKVAKAFQCSQATAFGGTTEVDETYVLDSYKGTKLPQDFYRGPRTDGKAQKPGISDEQVCICTLVHRGAGTREVTLNRATPSKKETVAAYKPFLKGPGIIVGDGQRSYPELARQTGTLYFNSKKSSDPVYNLDSVNRFHSFIKDRMRKMRGVATWYINQYNALLSISYGRSARPAQRLDGILEQKIGYDLFISIEHIQNTRIEVV